MRSRLGFDLAVLEFGDAFERARDATVLVDAPKPRKNERLKTSQPKYSREELLAFLGIDAEETTSTLSPLTDSMWDEMEWGDG
ncbi:MAG: hypothetical protein JSS40_08400 [Proteobacteria bacterium]|nr:hypothetical protein [Pseudomonadota bacterium]